MIIKQQPESSGAYAPPQGWNGATPAGYYKIADTIDLNDFVKYGGFVSLVVARDTVIGYTPDVVAWETWKAEHPEPSKQPTDTEVLNTLLGV